ncbi:MAG TPA: GNAT family N-acetyltransferase [Puia sp.]|nr:GNAT family N-acetyltransferase [Puia sp.]
MTMISGNSERLVQAVASNHRELFRQEAIALGGRMIESRGLSWTSGTPHSSSMIAFPEMDAESAGQQLDEVIAFYLREPPGGAACWALDPPVPGDLGIRLLARGFQPGWRPHWMAADLTQLSSHHPEPRNLRIVPDNETSLLAVPDLPYARVVIPDPATAEFPGQWTRFVAWVRGKVVGQSVVFLTSGPLGVAGIYHVGVVPGSRSKGIGKAVTRAACLYAQERGYRYAVLNSTEAGKRPYGQLGFWSTGDGWTWWLTTERLLAQPPEPAQVRLAEAIGRGDEAGLSALASGTGKAEVVTMLTNGMSLLQLAVHCRQPQAAEWLIARGAEYSALDAWDLGWKDRAGELLRSDREQIHRLYGKEGKNLLHIAVERNDEALAELALAAAPDLKWRDNTWNSTPLEWANHFGYSNIARMIRERKS